MKLPRGVRVTRQEIERDTTGKPTALKLTLTVDRKALLRRLAEKARWN
jgi:hypothetical protein